MTADRRRGGADTSRARGTAAEDAARRYLEGRGLSCLDRNYRSRAGEIDLVMREEDTIVFVEVRYRKSDAFGTGAESVTRSKQRRIINTALRYLQAKPRLEDKPCRFDVVSISGPVDAFDVQWIVDAFEA